MKHDITGVLRFGEKYLAERGCDDSRFDARQLLLFLTKCENSVFFTEPEKTLSDAQLTAYSDLLGRRATGEPLQYILGEWDFYKSEFSVGPGVLIPRPETEQLTDMCIKRIKRDGYRTVYDLCAGSGCIGLSVAAECPDVDVYLFELYDEAFSFLEKNRKMIAPDNAFSVKTDIMHGMPVDIPAPDVIISNPPYIVSGDIPGLQKEVLREPITALDGGKDGYAFYRVIAEMWLPHLKKGGYIAVECGEGQSNQIERLFAKYGETDVISDIYGIMRFVTATKF